MIHGNSKMTVIHTMRRLPWGDCNIAPLTVTHFRGTNASQFRMLYFATNSCMHLLTRFWIWSQPKIRWPLLVMRPQSYRANHYIRHLLNSCSQSDQSVTHSGRAQINGSVLLPVAPSSSLLFSSFLPHFILSWEPQKIIPEEMRGKNVGLRRDTLGIDSNEFKVSPFCTKLG